MPPLKSNRSPAIFHLPAEEQAASGMSSSKHYVYMVPGNECAYLHFGCIQVSTASEPFHYRACHVHGKVYCDITDTGCCRPCQFGYQWRLYLPGNCHPAYSGGRLSCKRLFRPWNRCREQARNKHDGNCNYSTSNFGFVHFAHTDRVDYIMVLW